MKYGLILEGGARRCVFTAGVLDCFMDCGLTFDYIAGVSAGARGMLDFVSGRKGCSREIAMPGKGHGSSLRAKLGCELDDIVYGCGFDADCAPECEIVATDVLTGEPAYFRCGDSDGAELEDMLRASCSLPILYPMAEVDGRLYVDGSVSDALPFERAFEQGCDRVVVISSKSPEETTTDYRKLQKLLGLRYERDYPALYGTLMEHYDRYAEQRRQLREYERQGSLLLIRPEERYATPFEMSTDKLDHAYQKGVKQGFDALEKMEGFSLCRKKVC